jgi:hypothetical protein
MNAIEVRMAESREPMEEALDLSIRLDKWDRLNF